MKAGIKGILLDIDDTLYPYEPAHRSALSVTLQYLGNLCGENSVALEARYNQAKKVIHHRLANSASSHNRLLYFQGVCEAVGLTSMPHAYSLYECYWEKFFETMKLDDGVIDFLEALKPVPICFLTDLTADIQFRKISRLGLDRFAQFVVTSEEAGIEKPDPRPFELAQIKLGLPPSSICMIGDHYEKDAMASINLGMSSVWLNRTDTPRPGHERLLEVKSFVDLNRVWRASA